MDVRHWVLATCGMGAVAACNLGKTDLGDLDTESSSTSPTEGSSESASESSDTAPPAECFDDTNCMDGCCDGFGCNFEGHCVACTPAGEFFDIDGAGCCEGLDASPAGICFDPACTDEGCDEGIVACAGLQSEHASDAFAADCVPEACLGSRTLVVSNAEGEDGFVCTGPDGSEACQASGEDALQQYRFDAGAISLHLVFDAAVLADYSTAGFNANFDSHAGQITIPDATAPILFFPQSGAISPFVYADGRLQFTITMQLDNPFARIESDAEDCVSDDILGECACYYEPLGEYVISVDLSIEAPPA